ncbi:Crinkler (CRN) [Phytophthora megakarya]|uniref:Crinkler (CRN) n=1 Tax=Phytophthora megakarya TaxID=4795 RepID=A0A225VH31_9STRA|nr:Crinkler (CRN) [Phytophthora megakarya]
MELCHGLSVPFDNEAKFAEKSRDLLADYLLEGYPALVIASVAVNGSPSEGVYYFGETLLPNLQCKLQQGDGGGDPTMQNIAFYIKTLPEDIDRHFPSPIEWFGIVNTSDEDANCEPLVSSFPLLYFDNEQLIVSLTRVCAALKTAVSELSSECEKFIANHQKCETTLERLDFPYKDSVVSNGAKTSFQYVEVVQHYVLKRSMLQIMLSSSSRNDTGRRCIKFVRVPDLLPNSCFANV